MAEVEDILRSSPTIERGRLEVEDHLAWAGRVAAAITRWNLPSSLLCHRALDKLHGPQYMHQQALNQLLQLLHQARADLRMALLYLGLAVSWRPAGRS